MSDVCLRNMSCTCRLCAGEDIATLVSISKSISSNIAYDDGDENGDETSDAPPPPTTLGRMTNSPPIPTARKSALPARQPPPPPATAAATPASETETAAPAERKSALPAQRKSALPTQRKSALPARRPLMAKRAPPVDEDVVMDGSGQPPPTAPPVAVAPPPVPVPTAVDSDEIMEPPAVTAAPPVAPPIAVKAPVAAASKPPPGADVCLRNMSCRCSLCAGEDTAMLVSISKSISSNIAYDDGDEGDEGESLPPPPPATLGRMTNSPPVPSVRKTVPLAPPAPVVAPPAPIAAAAAAPASMAVDSTGTDATESNWSVDEVVAKLADKNWKLRKEAFEHVKAHCERPGVRADDVEPFLEFFAKMCDDANASAMEAGVQAVLAYAVHVTPFQKSVVPGVMKKLTDKGFSSRPGVVKICEEVVQAFIEAGAADDTVAALIDGTKNKKPKVPPACCANLLDVLKAFGPRVVPLPAVKAALPALCESTVNGVRPIALNIVAEIHRWTGPALVQDIVSNLRQAQQTEYETLTKDIVLGQAAPTKFVRGAARPAAATGPRAGGAAAGASASAPGAGGGAFDPREFAETVDLLAKLPRTEFKAKLALPKWSEKVEALKIVLDLIGPVPKLANGDYYELVNTLKILSNDANVNIVAKAVEVLGALADGLRKQFTQYARMMFPELVRKLSDKKSVVLNATNTALDLFLQHAMGIDLMLDELKLALDASKNKAPQARVQTLAFLTRCVEKNAVSLTDKSLMLEFGGLFAAAMDDTDPSVRKAGLDALIVLLKASDQIAEWLQSTVDDIARKNPRSHKTILQSVGTGSGGGAASTRPGASVSAARAPPAAKKPADVVEVETPSGPPAASAARLGLKKPPVKGPPSRLAASKPAAETVSKPAASAAASRKPAATSGGGGSGGGAYTPIAISVAPEEAEDVIAELNVADWGAIQEGFASAKWMERKTAIEQLEAVARDYSSAMSMRMLEALAVFLSKQVKDFKDSNINVVKSAFQAIGTFAEHAANKFPRGVVCHVVPSAADKISDRKAAEAIRTMLLQLCEAVDPAYVLGCLLNHMPSVKAPLAHIEALVVLADCVKDFGVAVCSPRLLIDFVKGPQGLESSNPKVRTSAIAVLAAMYAQLGPALLPILALDTWKPALAALVEAEFKKTGFDPSSAMASVKRQVKGDDDESGGGGAKKLDTGALFGRVDISSQLTKELFADMKCEEDMAAWKKRAAAMDAVQSMCDASGGAIEFTKAVQEVLKALKARLSDSNANLKVKAAQVIGTIAACVGADIAKMSKFLGASLVGGVADNKKTMQTAAVEALHKWVRHNNATSSACVESLLPAVSEGLLNTVGRAELLGWAAEHLKHCKLDLTTLVVPTVQCLMDKSSEAREKAQLVLAEVIRSVGQDTVLTTGCRDIKPAQMRTLRPLVQKVCDSVAESAAAAAPTAPAAAAATPVAPSLPSAVPGTPTRSGPGALRLARAGSMPSKPGAASARATLTRPSSFRAASDAAQSEGSEDGSDMSTPGSTMTALLKMSTTKSARLAKGQHNKWIFESTSASEMAARKAELEAEWRPFLAPELHAKLFAPTLEKGMLAAVTDLMTCATTQPQELVSVLDLVLKWCSLRIVDNNVQALAKLLDFLVKLFEVLKALRYTLDDVEAAILLPYLLMESGQSKPRFRVRFRDIMKLVADVYSRERYAAYLTECFSACKNTRSRCECIDVVEYIVAAHGVAAVGKKCVKEIGKFVTAHEKELRESAINALVAVYTRLDGGDVDRFFRFVGITTQQGMDLLTARIKHLPATSRAGTPHESASMPPILAVQQPSTSFGFGFGGGGANAVPASPGMAPPAVPMRTAVTPPRMPPPMAVTKPFGNGYAAASSAVRMPQDDSDDTDMMALSIADEVAHDGGNDNDDDTIEALLLRPIDRLLTPTNELVDERSPLYADGIDALKGLYAIIDRPSGDSERAFLRYYVNDIFIKLCDLLHASFGASDANPDAAAPRPVAIHVLSLALPILNLLLRSDAAASVQRYAVERVILELCAQMLDPRVEEFAARASTARVDIAALPPARKRFLLLFKALVKALRGVTEHVPAGEVVPSVVNLLQRIVRNDVGDYNARGAYHHLMQTDSLDQLVGRLLLQLARTQAAALHPFEGVDLFGVLMQMHSFFSTLPQTTDLFAVQIANDNMQAALRLIAESLRATRRSSLEAALHDLPTPSPVRDLLVAMGLSSSPTETAGVAMAVTATSASVSASVRVATSAAAVTADGGDTVTRRLFGAAPSGASTVAATRDTTRARVSARSGATTAPHDGASAGASARSSFTSFNDFAASRTAATVRAGGDASGVANGASASTSSTTQLLRERLERVRKF